MKLIRCDVKGCNEECKGDEPGVLGPLPPGWRNEIWSEERRMPVPAAQAHALSLEEAGEVRNVTVRPLEPQEVRALAHGYAHVCPKHPRGYELREGVVSEPSFVYG